MDSEAIGALNTPTKHRKRNFAVIAVMLFGISTSITACDLAPDDNTAAKIIPSDARAFATIAISPSVSQKASLLELSQHLPNDVHAKDFEGAKGKAINEAVSDEGLSYDTDIKPWLGGEAAVAYLAPQSKSDDPIAYVLLKTKDKKKTQVTLDKKKVDATSYRYIGDYLVMADMDDIKNHHAVNGLDAIANTEKGKTKSLQSNNVSYKSALKSLNGQHLVLGWADAAKLADDVAAKQDADKTSDSDQTFSDGEKSATDQAKKFGTVAFEAYATGSNITVEVVTDKVSTKDAPASSHLTKTLPADSLGTLGISDFPTDMNKLLNYYNKEEAKNGPPSAQAKDLTTAESNLIKTTDGEAIIVGGPKTTSGFGGALVAHTTGKVATSAAITALGDKLKTAGLTVDPTNVGAGTGITVSMPQPAEEDDPYDSEDYPDESDGGFSSTDASIHKSTSVSHALKAAAFDDSEDFSDDYSSDDFSTGALDEYAGLLEEGSFTAVAVDNRLILSNDKDYIAKLVAAPASNLEDSDAFKAAVDNPDSSNVDGSLFLNIQGIFAAVKKAYPDEYKDSDKSSQWVNALSMFGTKTWHDDSHNYVELKLGVK